MAGDGLAKVIRGKPRTKRSRFEGGNGTPENRMEVDALGPPPALAPPPALGAQNGLEEGLGKSKRRRAAEWGGPPKKWESVCGRQALSDKGRPREAGNTLDGLSSVFPPMLGEDGFARVVGHQAEPQVFDLGLSPFRPQLSFASIFGQLNKAIEGGGSLKSLIESFLWAGGMHSDGAIVHEGPPAVLARGWCLPWGEDQGKDNGSERVALRKATERPDRVSELTRDHTVPTRAPGAAKHVANARMNAKVQESGLSNVKVDGIESLGKVKLGPGISLRS